MVPTNSKDRKRRHGALYLIALGGISIVIVAGVMALQPAPTPLDWIIRATAMLGFLAVFLTAISAVFMRELYQLLGRPFIRVHHVVAVAGLVLVTLHPVGVAIRSSSLRVFLPDFSSVDAFLSLGGRPAWYLIGLASLAALFRTRIKQSWRAIHYLNYVAFFLATAHALMIGPDFGSLAMRGVAALMALALVGVFVHKRLKRWRLTRRR